LRWKPTINSIALADWDLDGNVDGACGYFFGGLGLLKGTGGGIFTGAGNIYGGTFALESLTFGDMDSDGKPDIVVAGHSYVGILRNLGTTFAPVVTAPANSVREVSLGDLDMDGALDVCAGSSPVIAVRGDGAGGMFPATIVGLGEGSAEGAIVDIDRDGIRDIVYNASSGASVFDVKYARGLGSFTFAPPVVLAPATINDGFVACDLDADGQPDLIAMALGVSGVRVYRNLSAPAPLTLLYGIGTAGCLGTQGVSATGLPTVGNAAFGVVLTNTPLTAVGLGIICDIDDAAGSDPFGLGILLHCDLAASTEVLAFDVSMSAKNSAYLALPIPNAPVLSGLTYYTQFLSLWPADAACQSSPLGLSSSKVLRIRIL